MKLNDAFQKVIATNPYEGWLSFCGSMRINRGASKFDLKKTLGKDLRLIEDALKANEVDRAVSVFSKWFGAAIPLVQDEVLAGLSNHVRTIVSPQFEGDLPFLLVGPVLGRVTAGAARVLIECDVVGSQDIVSLELQQNGEIVQTIPVQVRAGLPIVTIISNLDPGTTYDLQVRGIANESDPCSQGLLRTPTEGAVDGINVGVVSCNKLSILRRETVKYGSAVDMWESMKHDMQQNVDNLHVLLHVGDQVYADDRAFRDTSSYIRSHMDEDSATAAKELETLIDIGTEAYEMAANFYRNLYRRVWRHKATRWVLSRVSNLMIWDDHEVVDDFGSKADARDPASVARTAALVARHVMREYQRQLWDERVTQCLRSEVLHTPTTPAASDQVALSLRDTEIEMHYHTLGDQIGVVFLDSRGPRSFGAKGADPKHPSYLGKEQWERLTALLESEASLFSGVATLMIVTTVPLVITGRRRTACIGRYMPACFRCLCWGCSDHFTKSLDDMQDHWADHENVPEQRRLLHLLADWQTGKGAGSKGERRVLVLGGDVHFGAKTNITRGEARIFQVVSSPITNDPMLCVALSFLRCCGMSYAQNVRHSDESGTNPGHVRVRYHHEWVVRRQNYSILTIANGDQNPGALDAAQHDGVERKSFALSERSPRVNLHFAYRAKRHG